LGEQHVFLDVAAIAAGMDFESVILERLRAAHVVLVVISPEWAALADDAGRRRLEQPDDFVRREIEVALAAGIRIVPVLVDGATMPTAAELPASIGSLAGRQAVPLSDRRWRAEVAELLAELSGRPPRRSALAHHRTRFIGREEDVTGICELLTETGFVTAVGPGGVGKSRLALEVAARVGAGYRDGVVVAELAAIDHPAQVDGVVATAIAGGDGGSVPATIDGIVGAAAHQQLLVVIDNCEHVIDRVAALVDAVLAGCPDVGLLATSREALSVAGEAVWRVEPLPVSAAGAEGDVTESPAGQLFVDRARLADRSFQLDERTAPQIARIVRGLDGLPLALELAAAALRTLDVDDLAAEVERGALDEAGERRSGTARHRTLAATVDWSYRLLDADERLVFERLGVFAGAFDAETAEQVCGADLDRPTVRGAVRRLVECSLVDRVEAPSGNARLRLLVTVRDEARRRLGQRPGDPTPQRLVGWAVGVAEEHGRAVDRGDELDGLRVLDAEHPNLLAALAAADQLSAREDLARLAVALTPYWELRGLLLDGQHWIERALEHVTVDSALRVDGLLAAARLQTTAAFAERRRWYREALDVAERLADDARVSAALAALGHIDFETEERDAARAHVEAALIRARASGDEARIAVALERVALYRQGEADTTLERELLGEAIEIYERLGNRRGALWCLAELGFADLTAGDVERAEQAFERGLELGRVLGYPHGEAWMLDALAEVAVAAGRPAAGHVHFLAAHQIQRRLGDELNRGWTIGGLVRTSLRTGQLDEAVRWLDEALRYLLADVVPRYEYGFLLRAGCVAAAFGWVELAARILGAMDAREPPPSLSPTDRAERDRLEADAAAALGAAALAAARAEGRHAGGAELGREVLDRARRIGAPR
jgi:predicted ATPase